VALDVLVEKVLAAKNVSNFKNQLYSDCVVLNEQGDPRDLIFFFEEVYRTGELGDDALCGESFFFCKKKERKTKVSSLLNLLSLL